MPARRRTRAPALPKRFRRPGRRGRRRWCYESIRRHDCAITRPLEADEILSIGHPHAVRRLDGERPRELHDLDREAYEETRQESWRRATDAPGCLQAATTCSFS